VRLEPRILRTLSVRGKSFCGGRLVLSCFESSVIDKWLRLSSKMGSTYFPVAVVPVSPGHSNLFLGLSLERHSRKSGTLATLSLTVALLSRSNYVVVVKKLGP